MVKDRATAERILRALWWREYPPERSGRTTYWMHPQQDSIILNPVGIFDTLDGCAIVRKGIRSRRGRAKYARHLTELRRQVGADATPEQHFQAFCLTLGIT